MQIIFILYFTVTIFLLFSNLLHNPYVALIQPLFKSHSEVILTTCFDNLNCLFLSFFFQLIFYPSIWVSSSSIILMLLSYLYSGCPSPCQVISKCFFIIYYLFIKVLDFFQKKRFICFKNYEETNTLYFLIK